MRRIYQENISYLSKSKQCFIASLKETEQIKLLDSKIGKPTIKLNTINGNEIFLHSKYNPEKEAERFVANYNIESAEAIILIGFGLGYHVKKFLKKLDRKQILYVIVTNLRVFKKALKCKHVKAILSDQRLKLILEKDFNLLVKRLEELLKRLINKENKLVVHSQSVQAIPEEFSFLKDILEKIRMSYNNQRRYGEKIKNNIKENLKQIKDNTGIKSFRGIFNNVPIFVVGAGPSLEKNVDKLKLIRDKGMIIAVDTALPILLDVEVTPDFIVTIDPEKNENNRFYTKIQEVNIPLVYSIGACSEVIKNYKGDKIVGFPKRDLLLDKLEKVIAPGRIESGFSVSITALDFAYNLGGNPIVFVGQDFAYGKKGVTHVSNSFSDEKKEDLSLLREVKGIDGEKVYTSTRYYLPLKECEKYIIKNKQTNYIDATEGGAKIKGTEVMPLEKVINAYCNRNSIGKKEILEKIISEYSFKIIQISDSKIQKIIKEELS